MTELVDNLDLGRAKPGELYRCRVAIVENGLAEPIWIPVIVARGIRPGPVVGFTAAMHGNELNGVRVIHKLLEELKDEVRDLSGTIVAVPVVNVPGFLNAHREYSDGIDLNRVMPGKSKGNTSEVYASRFIKRIVRHFDYLIDLHTASFGRVNSLYVRADMQDSICRKLALLQCPQIIVHNKGKDGTLRSAAAQLGIPSITVEVGNPQLFQRKLIRFSLVGIHNILSYLNMIPADPDEPQETPVICRKSQWIYTDVGGLLNIPVEITQRVERKQLIGRVHNVFGDLVKKFFAPEAGIVVGKSTNPVAQSGARVVHLGDVADEGEFPSEVWSPPDLD